MSPRADLGATEKVPGPGAYTKVMRPLTSAPTWGIFNKNIIKIQEMDFF